ncbi:MAG TPA: molybdopterin synthase sulfur carrier subunit [Microbacterium sp.]|nr:molybdopterin synthase sulfur carrier subunit [Microbacterium sp.]
MQISYYAGAADAAGLETEQLDADQLTVTELIGMLGTLHDGLAPVLTRCSLLVDGQRVDDPEELISAGSRIDVLPPFAGG